MDRMIVERKLDSLRCLQRIQDIVVLNLTRAVQLCVDLASYCLGTAQTAPPNTMGETFDRMAEAGLMDGQLAERMKKSVGFRNLAVHSYSRSIWK